MSADDEFALSFLTRYAAYMRVFTGSKEEGPSIMFRIEAPSELELEILTKVMKQLGSTGRNEIRIQGIDYPNFKLSPQALVIIAAHVNFPESADILVSR